MYSLSISLKSDLQGKQSGKTGIYKKGFRNMEKHEKRLKFIELRAEGWSFAKICGEIHISKATCSSWEKELETEIKSLRGERLAELYDSYGMAKEARIKKLGKSLEKIDRAIDAADLSTIPPEKLLKIKLDYERELKNEYAPQSSENIVITDSESILNALNDLVERARLGDASDRQINRETAALTALMKGFENVEICEKLDRLEMMMKGGEHEKD